MEKLPIFSRLPISLDQSRRCLRRSDLKDAELVDLGEASRIYPPGEPGLLAFPPSSAHLPRVACLASIARSLFEHIRASYRKLLNL